MNEAHVEVADNDCENYWSSINVNIHRVEKIIIIPRLDEPPVQQISLLNAEGNCIFQVTVFGKNITIENREK